MNKQDLIDGFGYAGAVFLTLLTLPQVYHCYKNKSTGDITWSFLFLEIMTSISFCIYGGLLPSTPVIVANSVAFVGTTLLIIAKAIFNKKDSKTIDIEMGKL